MVGGPDTIEPFDSLRRTKKGEVESFVKCDSDLTSWKETVP